MTSQNKSVMGFNLSYMFNEKERLTEFFAELFAWIADGSLKVAKVTEFALTDVASAHRALESGNTVGKLVLLTGGDDVREEMKVEEKKTDTDSCDNSKLLD